MSEVVMAVLTASSLIVAFLALKHARNAAAGAQGAVFEAKKANDAAKKANGIAEQSNSLAKESNGIAGQAARDAREAPTQAAWDQYVAAISTIQSFDPATKDPEEAGSLLTQLRVRATLLVDRLEGPGWEPVGEWLVAEQVAGALLMREACVKGGTTRQRLRRGLTDDETMKIDEQYHLWVARLTQNVRYCRRVGPEQTPFEDFTAAGWERIKTTATRNGWPVPTGKIEGLEPYVPKQAPL